MEEVPVFRPTMAEFADFAKFVASIKEQCRRSGICKVIPPPEWKPTKKPYEASYKIVIPAPIQQIVTGKQGVFQQMNIESKQMTVEKFKEQAERVSEEQGISKLDPQMVCSLSNTIFCL
jgi:jumonji domain-containing protein 2